MKHQPTLPTKREPIRKGLMKRLHAVTRKRKQHRAATAMAGDFETELPGRKIGMALAVIVGVHVVAAGLVFFHHWRLEGRGGDAATSSASKPAPVLLASGGSAANLPQISPGDQTYAPRSGDTYASIAAKHDVDVNDLRQANLDTPVQAGRILKIPSKRIVAMPPPEVAAIREAEPPEDRGNIPPKAVPVPEAALLVHPSRNGRESADNFRAVDRSTNREPRPSTTSKASAPSKSTAKKTPATPKATVSNTPKATSEKNSAAKKPTKKSYTVKSGDNLVQIASRTGSDQKAIMKANGITDARKLKPGAVLVIPN